MSIGILAALVQRGRTGTGQRIDISMQDCIFSILENAVVRYTMTGQNPSRIGSRHASVAPYDVFQASDGYVIIACANEATWQRLCKAMEKPELITDERFLLNDNRSTNIVELGRMINEWASQFTMNEILLKLQHHAVPGAPILTIADLASDPHIEARNMLIEVEHPVAGKVRIPGNPIKLSASADCIERPAPVLGQHSEEILEQLGYSPERIAELQQNHII
jgi:crotonobetainyl-CoA:carnitine CoA-transferase CaiB-like acyl-CoA transferase